MGVAALFVANLLLKGRTGVLLGLSKPAPISDINHNQSLETKESFNSKTELNENAMKLHKVMAEGFYRTEKLTIQKLSKKIDLPEYKTRALINQTLAYRNFNDYINQLRIAEAGKRLISEPDTPILNIALDVGYRTLSSFNRAFKEIFEQSPTAYRQSKSTLPTKSIDK